MGGGMHYPPPDGGDVVGSPTGAMDKHLRGIVDMGSNGIRFSVSSLAPPTTRVLPTLVSYRLDISLYDAQYDDITGERVPIPQPVIDSIVAALLRFKIICNDLGVMEKHIRIVATEATRTAVNSEAYRRAIKDATKLEVEMLGKEEEGYVGALGVASGFSDMSGIVLDMGGGSCQISWLTSKDGHVQTSPQGSISFPYGAAALTRKLADLRKKKSEEDGDAAVDEFRHEMTQNFVQAYRDLEIPKHMIGSAIKHGGFELYLSGGGFRGWGYLLLYMNQTNGHHYPISLINGYSAPHHKFADVERLKKVARQAEDIFRVSDRRRSQVPAVAFLVNVLATSLPHGILKAHFCQGGVREGVLFRDLPQDIRNDDPLETGTMRYAKKSAAAIGELLLASVPYMCKGSAGQRFPKTISKHLIHALANLMYVHSPMSKETASTAALYCTSTGFMSSTHGVSHADRALLGLMLEERFEGELPPREEEFKQSLRAILSAEEVWWTRYLGTVAMVLSKIYPAGVVDSENPRLTVASEWANGLGKKGAKSGIRFICRIKKLKDDPLMLKEMLEDHIGDVRKVGKKKNYIGGKKGWGMKVVVVVEAVDELK